MKAAWLIVSGPGQSKSETSAELSSSSGTQAVAAQASARIEVIADTFLSMNAPIQLAIPSFLVQRRGFQKQLMERVRGNLVELDHQLAKQKSCTRMAVEGGWNAVIRVPATRSDEDLALELLAIRGIYVHPGHFYDFATQGYLVVSLIAGLHDFAKGMESLLSLF
jgi:aspartate/methionine/tyrosine aminotransferase